MRRRGAGVVFSVLGVGACLLFVLRLLVGPIGFGFPEDGVLLELRLLMAVSAVGVGVSLATSGVVLQSVLRNPLASPYVLGMTAGAALGVVVGIYLSHVLDGGIAASEASPVAALAGAMFAAGGTFLLARRGGGLPAGELILVGVIVGTLCGSLSLAIQQLLPDGGLATAARWMMGEVDPETEWVVVVGVVFVGMTGTFLAWRHSIWFDAATLSDLESGSIGAPAHRTRAFAFGLAAVMTAGVVVLAGPIGFVGLVAPHVARLLVGPRHRSLLPGAALVGVALMLGAESIAASVRTPTGRVPVGIVTALIGAPLFVVILKRSRGMLDGGGV